MRGWQKCQTTCFPPSFFKQAFNTQQRMNNCYINQYLARRALWRGMINNWGWWRHRFQSSSCLKIIKLALTGIACTYWLSIAWEWPRNDLQLLIGGRLIQYWPLFSKLHQDFSACPDIPSCLQPNTRPTQCCLSSDIEWEVVFQTRPSGRPLRKKSKPPFQTSDLTKKVRPFKNTFLSWVLFHGIINWQANSELDPWLAVLVDTDQFFSIPQLYMYSFYYYISNNYTF